MKPEEVPADLGTRVLERLNAAKSAEEIAEIVEIPGERDVGLKLGENIISERERIGGFTKLSQVYDVPLIGPERFAQIVNSLALTSITPKFTPSVAITGPRPEWRSPLVIEQLLGVIRTLGIDFAVPLPQGGIQLPGIGLRQCEWNTCHYDPNGQKVCMCIKVTNTDPKSNSYVNVEVDGDKAGNVRAPGYGTFCGKTIKVHCAFGSVEVETKYGKCQ